MNCKNFEEGEDADVVLIDWKATNLQKLRIQNSSSIAEELFVLQVLGIDLILEQTYIMGNPVKL